MATRGAKPQPDAMKIAKGETRPSRLSGDNVVEFPTADRVPDPPEWLTNSDACALWSETAGVLFAQKVLATADVHALGHLCQLHGEVVDGYRRRIQPTAATLSQLRMYFAEFGLTPSSRTRVSKTGNGEQGNPFRKNGKTSETPAN
jgi:phage terminase small subunit